MYNYQFNSARPTLTPNMFHLFFFFILLVVGTCAEHDENFDGPSFSCMAGDQGVRYTLQQILKFYSAACGRGSNLLVAIHVWFSMFMLQ